MASTPLSELKASTLNICPEGKTHHKSLLMLTSKPRTDGLHPSCPNETHNVNHEPKNESLTDHTGRTTNSLPSSDFSSPAQPQSKRHTLSSQMNFESVKPSRKISSPDRRFPVKPYSPHKSSPAVQAPSTEDVLRDNEGLTKVMEILEGKEGSDSDEGRRSDDTLISRRGSVVADEDNSNLEDTMVSTYSTFSAIPGITTFSELRQNMIKSPETYTTSRTQSTPISYRRSLVIPPTSDRKKDDWNTTNLLEFTADIERYTDKPSPAKLARQSALQNTKLLDMTLTSSPSFKRHSVSNLLDFDIPPAPTPRSMPTITPRELESLKSGFLFEISSLKASLSGKEAEVCSLKSAVEDAEKRVGESLEQIREEQGHSQQLAADKLDWEKRGREMEALLRSLQDQIVRSEQNREELVGRLSESDARRQAAELMAQEAESRVAAIRAGRLSPESEAKLQGTIGEGRLVEVAVEKVSRELHTLYKEKHETKVAALRKSYERRWDSRVNELEKQVEDLMSENQSLKSERDIKSAESNSVPSKEVAQKIEKLKELEAKIESAQEENTDLRKFLADERIEKDKLIQHVEEMIPLIASFDELLGNMGKPHCDEQIKPQAQTLELTHVENLRGSLSKASGIRAPMCHANIGESRIGKGGFGIPTARESRGWSTSNVARPLSGIAGKSGIMSSIERMGSHKGRGKC